MKTLCKLALLGLVAILLAPACTKSGGLVNPVEPQGPQPMRFYGVKYPVQTRGAAQHDRCWHNGTTIKIKFLNGNPTLQQKVINYAKEWEQYANITFMFVNNGDAHVRIGFDWNFNRWLTWSYIGTDCKMELNQNEATLSFADFDYLTDNAIRADVLRAFGQVLGLELESRNINFTPQWSANPNMVPNYWAFNITDIQWAILKQYVFDPLDSANALSTATYDPLSIMKWPFPTNVLLNGGGNASNTDLSADDKTFIAQLYPKEAPVVTLVPDGQISLTLGINAGHSVTVDWGDGTTTTFGAGLSNDSRGYWYLSGVTVKIYGSSDAIYRIETCYIKALDVSKATQLKYLEIVKHYAMTSLDVSNNTLLETLICTLGGISSLDLSNNLSLLYLDCWYNYLTSLDVSGNPLLETLNCSSNQLTSLDVSGNPQIKTIQCYDNPFLQNQSATVAFANSLPNRTGLTAGTIGSYVSSSISPWIGTICTTKNWTIN